MHTAFESLLKNKYHQLIIINYTVLSFFVKEIRSDGEHFFRFKAMSFCADIFLGQYVSSHLHIKVHWIVFFPKVFFRVIFIARQQSPCST